MEVLPMIHSQNDKDATKYHVILQSGRDFILNASKDVESVAWEAYEEACLMDDYLVDIIPVN
tara:strand:- start:603 stop:788 length:186 start_codon:yes stop_codon:yes gene_type:complete